MATNTKTLLAGIILSATAGCAFFEEPVSELRDLAPASPASTSNSPPAPAPQTQVATPTAPTATIQSSPGTSYLIVAPIENLPDDAGNVAVVHFTRKDTERALALCKALIENLQLTDVQDLPAQATNVALWPVANDNAGSNCIEMMTDYEPIDISVEAAKRVNDTAEGPFLLTQHMLTGKRMIYDMSFVSRNVLKTAMGEWKSLIGSEPANWPAYRRAR